MSTFAVRSIIDPSTVAVYQDDSPVVVHGLLIGTSAQDALNGGDTCADPAVLENALGVTWDTLDLCLSFGIGSDHAKGLFGVGDASENVRKALSKDAITGGYSGHEQRIDPVSRNGGIVSEVRPGFVSQDAGKDIVDRGVNDAPVSFLDRLRGAFRGFNLGARKLDAGEHAGKPVPLSTLTSEFEQDHVRGQFKGSDAGVLRRVGIVGHGSTSVDEGRIQPRDRDSGKVPA